ncbi:MAG: hypothetical protein K9H49_17940 [Bacteroidales bacterium]|nr:hypothetical protein [Bacteroidales bacterium]MCF8391373.1 hypothetical protein [Bacteroidales bacterium]
MKYIFSFMLVFHGAIHLMGFVKAFNLSRIDQLTANISKISGVFWLIAFILFSVTTVAFLLKSEYWYIPALIAIVISTALIISTWQDAKYGTIPNVVILVIAIFAFGHTNFYGKYKKDVSSYLSQMESTQNSLLTEKDMEHLPEPVKKYLRYTGSVGKPKVRNFRIELTGKIRQDEKSDWMPFTTVQYNFLDNPTRLFFMEAEMKKLPVAGYHCFKNGEASMDIRLLSLIKVQYQSGKEMNISETVTFFNDMCCMAPATLIDKRICWLSSNGNEVKAEFTIHNITVSASLYFNEKGELINFVSEDRYAAGKNDSMQRLPWFTPLSEYKELDDFKLAGKTETIYTYPEGDFCYGIFNIRGIGYNILDIK